jgi:nucleoside phosphorylase
MIQRRLLLVACTAVVTLSGSCRTTDPAQKRCRAGNDPLTAILGAFTAEVALLEDQLTDRQEYQIEGIKFAAGKVGLRKIETVEGKREPKIVKGVVVTGDAFIASDKKCEELRKRLDADAVEMEGAAVAQICYQREIPHLVIRSISDKADEGAVADKQMFYILAARNSSDLVSEMMRLAAGGQYSEIKNR